MPTVAGFFSHQNADENSKFELGVSDSLKNLTKEQSFLSQVKALVD